MTSLQGYEHQSWYSPGCQIWMLTGERKYASRSSSCSDKVSGQLQSPSQAQVCAGYDETMKGHPPVEPHPSGSGHVIMLLNRGPARSSYWVLQGMHLSLMTAHATSDSHEFHSGQSSGSRTTTWCSYIGPMTPTTKRSETVAGG